MTIIQKFTYLYVYEYILNENYDEYSGKSLFDTGPNKYFCNRINI